MKTYNRIVYDHFDTDSPESVYEIEEAKLPDTLPDDRIQVRILIAPIHPADTTCATGAVTGIDFPCIAGVEALGVIEKVGNNYTDQWQVGQRVTVCSNYIFGNWVTWQGAWSQYLICPSEALIAVPDGVSDESAAQFMANPLSSFAYMKDIGIAPGNILLQTAANSIFARMIIQYSRVYGFETINLVRHSDRAEQLKSELNIDSVYVYDGSPESAEQVRTSIARDFSGRHIDYCIDPIGAETASFCLSLLGPDGVLYIHGLLSGNVMLTINAFHDILLKNNTLKGWSVQETWCRKKSDAEKRQTVAELWELIVANKVHIPKTGE